MHAEPSYASEFVLGGSRGSVALGMCQGVQNWERRRDGSGKAKARIRSLWIVTTPRAILLAIFDMPPAFVTAYHMLPVRDKAPGSKA